ncbi:MAG TPA: hypothetical protein PKV72_06725, partial [Candidatus Peribacteria bacterium]|nr:hypothetical protein [Candidatus Peribacteria bacterium]
IRYEAAKALLLLPDETDRLGNKVFVACHSASLAHETWEMLKNEPLSEGDLLQLCKYSCAHLVRIRAWSQLKPVISFPGLVDIVSCPEAELFHVQAYELLATLPVTFDGLIEAAFELPFVFDPEHI